MDVFDTYYYDQDHLGNIRQVTDKSGKAVQTTDYYPFGMQLCDGTTSSFDQNHKCNGQGSCQRVQTSSLSMPSAAEAQPKVKEFDTMHGLNTYDYGARQYNPVTARWDRMDPLCEKYYSVSPYVYCVNNPIKYIDPDGKKIKFAKGCSQEFKNNSAKAIKYLNDHHCSGIFANLEKSKKTTIYIAEATSKIKEKHISAYIDKDKTIYWDPYTAVLTTAGAYLSPTTILNHEADHANAFLTNPEQAAKDSEENDPDYGKKIEKNAIEGTEQTTALALGEIYEGEVTREDHAISEKITVSDPTSTGCVVVVGDSKKKKNEKNCKYYFFYLSFYVFLWKR